MTLPITKDNELACYFNNELQCVFIHKCRTVGCRHETITKYRPQYNVEILERRTNLDTPETQAESEGITKVAKKYAREFLANTGLELTDQDLDFLEENIFNAIDEYKGNPTKQKPDKKVLAKLLKLGYPNKEA